MNRQIYDDYPVTSREPDAEINNHYLPRKDITVNSPLSSPMMVRKTDVHSHGGGDTTHIQNEILRLKHYQQIEHQRLIEKYQQEQNQLAAMHEKQLEEHLKVRQHMLMLQKQQEFLEQQRKLEEQHRLEQKMQEEKLAQIKNKSLEQQSAIASMAVKQKLQEFVLNKKQREAAVNNIRNSSQFRWAHHSSLDQSSPPSASLSPPYRPHLLGQFDELNQLRRTASEPNLKVRSVLKQKVIERRSSPLIQRRNRTPLSLKSRKPLGVDTTGMSSGSTPDSGPNSPPSNTMLQSSNGSLTSLHTREGSSPAELPLQQLKNMMAHGSYSDLTLYASPSMPNISLGRPPQASPNAGTNNNSPQSEAEIRAMAAARLGLPLTGHYLPGAYPYYHPGIMGVDPESTASNPAYISTQMKVLEQMRSTGKLATHPAAGAPYVVPKTGTITDSQVAHARLHRHRPLGRTQSAPLPLGQPMLGPQHGMLLQHQHEQFMKENQSYNLKQHIRQQVLQRAGSKNHMENVDEETEAKLAQEMKESREKLQEEADDIVVIDKDESEATIRRELEQHHHHPQTDRKAFLSEQRDILRLHPAHAPAVSGTSSVHAPLIPINVPARRPPHRPLSRTQSSPLVTFNFPRPSNPPEQQEPLPLRFTTGIAYDTMMLKHQCTCGNNQNHPEHAGRIQSIWARLQEAGLAARCEKVKARKASREELQSCHSEVYTLIYGTNPLHRQKLDPQILETLPTRFCMLPCGGIGVDSDTVWNELHTSYAARMATGCAIETSMKVAAGELKNGMAIVRPPGHHAEHQQPMGFCFFNSVAVAAKQLREKLNLRRILIVDWDVHHGNGTQQVFYNDPSVMYISLHRHDDGNFFPGTGALDECGEKEGLGYTVNVAFTGSLDPPMRDADYMMAFRTVVMPIAREFNPELVLVSAGFDAAKGHPAPLGGYELSGACFGHMTKQLMTLAGGKVVLVLEGGYDLPAICDASEICVKALLGDEVRPLSEEETNRKPCEAAIKTVQAAISYQARYWPVVTKFADSITMSMMEAQRREQREREENDTVSALASLSMVTARRSGGLSSMSSTESEPMEES